MSEAKRELSWAELVEIDGEVAVIDELHSTVTEALDALDTVNGLVPAAEHAMAAALDALLAARESEQSYADGEEVPQLADTETP